MKKILLLLTLFGTTILSKAQEASVEKSVSGIQTGLLGLWVHNELRLTNQFVLRSEIGLDTEILHRGYIWESGFVSSPVITLEPRWYYNLNKRSSKTKVISGNSGNFLSLRSSYHPDWFVISPQNYNQALYKVLIIPSWGIRRNIGKHMNYESGIGLGFRGDFKEVEGSQNESGLVVDIRLRIGYRF